jgi:cytoskeleton protein RodZ
MAQSREVPPQNTGENPEKSLGKILKEARERQGLDYAQLSEMTKLQPHILESLEKEEWHTFSAPVFIKGFLRSYAGALELDVGVVLTIYDEKNPTVDSGPHPLSSLAASRRRTPALFVFLALLAVAVFFALHYVSKRETRKQLPVVEPRTPALTPTPEKNDHTKGDTVGREQSAKPETTPETAQKEPEQEAKTDILEKQSTPEAVQEEIPVPAAKTVEPLQQDTAKSITETPNPVEMKPAPPAKTFLLKAEVRETTWVKIILDRGEPKEYIFQPGSRPEWKAQEGFELFIGNAGGIALEFNGRKMDNLGGHGKVIHLKLPQKGERNGRE